MSGRGIAVAVAAGVVVGWTVGLMTDPGVYICVDGTDRGYCEKQGGPNLLAALGAALLTIGVVSVAMWLRQRRR